MAKTKAAKNQPTVTGLAAHAEEIRRLGKRAVEDVIEIGRLLIECKRLLSGCGHGHWLSWLEREFGWSERTAQNFMRVHELTQSKSANFADLSIGVSALYLLAAPSTPEKAVDEIIDRAEGGEPMPVGKVKRVVKKAKERNTRTEDTGDGNGADPEASAAAGKAFYQGEGAVSPDPNEADIAASPPIKPGIPTSDETEDNELAPWTPEREHEADLLLKEIWRIVPLTRRFPDEYIDPYRLIERVPDHQLDDLRKTLAGLEEFLGQLRRTINEDNRFKPDAEDYKAMDEIHGPLPHDASDRKKEKRRQLAAAHRLTRLSRKPNDNSIAPSETEPTAMPPGQGIAFRQSGPWAGDLEIPDFLARKSRDRARETAKEVA